MSRDGTGQYSLPAGNPVITDTLITSVWANVTMADVAAALTQSISADGQTIPTQNLPMGALAHTNVGAAVQDTQYARADQVQSAALVRFTATSMPSQDVYTANLIFGATSFSPNQLVIGSFPAANVGPATFNLNGSGAAPIVRTDGSPLQGGDIVAGAPAGLLWDGARWRLLGAAGTNGVTSFNGRIGVISLLLADVLAALGYTPVNVAGDAMTGDLMLPNLTATAKITTPQVVLTPDTTLATALNFANGQTKVFTMAGALAITAISGLPLGSMGRLTVLGTNTGALSFPAVCKWPQPTELPPNFAAGSLKKAMVSFEFDGTHYLMNASVY